MTTGLGPDDVPALRDRVRADKITRTALILVGPALAGTDFRDSALYDGAHPHILRPKRSA